MNRALLAAAFALLSGPAWAETNNVPPPDKSAPKFGPDCGQGAVWDSVAHQCTTIFKPATKMPIAPGMTIAPVNDPYRDITIGQPGMTTIRCEHGAERIEITPTSEVRMFCKGMTP